MRKALGRGLDSLIKQTIKDVSVENTTQETAQPIISKTENVQTEIKVGEIQNISVNKIIANRFQPRQNFNQESLKELAESIKKTSSFKVAIPTAILNNCFIGVPILLIILMFSCSYVFSNLHLLTSKFFK